MRFDLRGRDGAGSGAIYRAALDMAAWSEHRGCAAIVLSEHHCSPDGYLPSPVVMASAIAGRTASVQIMIAAAVLPFYDPVRLAEDLVVLDLVSEGRVSVVLGLGYRPEEFALYGVPMADRASIVEAKLTVLLDALRHGRVDDGVRVGAVSPRLDPGDGPRLSYGGASPVAARRAARFGLDFFGQSPDERLRAAYLEEAARCGVEPGNVTLPPPDTPHALFVAEDVDRAWDELGPFLLADATAYAAWNAGDTTTSSLSRSGTVDDLRRERASHQVVSVDEAVELLRRQGHLTVHPLCGGIPPEMAWPYLRRVAEVVLPAAGA